MKDIISVLTTIYNEPLSWVKECIDSVVAQNHQNYKIEIVIVIDNPHLDASYILEFNEYIDSLKFERNDIVIIHNERNIGLADSLNKAFANSKGQYIARIDTDDVCATERFYKQYNFLMNNDEVSIVGGHIIRIDEDGKEIGRAKNSLSFEDIKNKIYYKSVCYHPTWMMRRAVFESLNGYRSYPNSQDFDFLLRAYENKNIISNIDDFVVYYRIRKSSLSFTHSLRQRKCQEHILKMSRKRLKGVDEFDKGIMLKEIKSSSFYNHCHTLSQNLFYRSMVLMKNRNVLFPFYLITSISISPAQFRYVVRQVEFYIKSRCK
ncbi:glycosyltransferase [Aeromonas media]|uniref:glycosyltransferase n=1 Tax=Aeromonas media TaxID=651 RepID=UPI0038D0BA88